MSDLSALSDSLPDMGATTEEAVDLNAIASAMQGFGHNVRIRALVLMEGERSPGDIAAVLGEPLGVVSYHVRMLRDYGMIELTRTEPRRGALQHYYQRTDLAETVLARVAPLINLPPRKAGEYGTEKRLDALAKWAAEHKPAEDAAA